MQKHPENPENPENIESGPNNRIRNSLFTFSGIRLLASANSTTEVELIVELIRELFIVELLNYNFSDFQKAGFI